MYIPARSLVKDVKPRVSQQCPRKAEQLPLTVAQLLFGHSCIKPSLLKQAPDVAIDERLDDLFIGRCAAGVEIMSNATREEKRLLHDAHDAGTDEIAWDRGDVETVDQDAASERV